MIPKDLRDLETRGCSNPSVVRALLRAQEFLKSVDLVGQSVNLFRVTNDTNCFKQMIFKRRLHCTIGCIVTVYYNYNLSLIPSLKFL